MIIMQSLYLAIKACICIKKIDIWLAVTCCKLYNSNKAELDCYSLLINNQWLGEGKISLVHNKTKYEKELLTSVHCEAAALITFPKQTVEHTHQTDSRTHSPTKRIYLYWTSIFKGDDFIW